MGGPAKEAAIHTALIRRVAYLYLSKLGHLYSLDDLIQEGHVVALLCAETHDPSRRAFNTYLIGALHQRYKRMSVHHHQQKRTGVTVDIDDVAPEELMDPDGGFERVNLRIDLHTSRKLVSGDAARVIDVVLELEAGFTAKKEITLGELQRRLHVCRGRLARARVADGPRRLSALLDEWLQHRLQVIVFPHFTDQHAAFQVVTSR